MMRTLLAATAALALSACVGGYGYVYDYDPYRGPVGRYVGPGEPHVSRSGLPCANVYYTGPHDGGLRGPYYSGPYCAPDAAQAAANAVGP
jgi:hypothetical protein